MVNICILMRCGVCLVIILFAIVHSRAAASTFLYLHVSAYARSLVVVLVSCLCVRQRICFVYLVLI